MAEEMRQLALENLGKTCLVMYKDVEGKLAGTYGCISRVETSIRNPPYPEPEVLERFGVSEDEPLIPLRFDRYDCLWITYGGGSLGTAAIAIEDISSIEEPE